MRLPDRFATARLAMRPTSAADIEALHAIWSDPIAMTYWSHPPHTELAETRDWLATAAAETGWKRWAITLAGEGRAVGTLGAHEKRQGAVYEIGYSLARELWGHGYAGEAVSGLIDALFAAGARRVFADTDPDNAASNALLTRLGFTVEGRLRCEWETHIGVRDSLMWGLLAHEWRR